MKSQKSKVKIFGWLTFILIPLPGVLGLLHKGFFDPHDMHHLADIYEMYRAILSGQIPPRLGPDFSFGYTYPLFNYYYLLPFYIGAFFYWLFGSLTWSFKFVLILCVILSYFGMYKFLRLHFNKLASIGGAALFLYTPYRAVQIYVRGSMGEILALSLLPWVLYLVGKYLGSKDNKYFALGALVYFLMVISHNYFFALFLPIILFYALTNLKDSKETITKIWSVFVMLFLGIGSASYWLIPALLEKKLVRGETPFLLADHFPFIKQLLIPSWGYGSSVWGPTDEISFQIGIINLLATMGLGYLYFRLWKMKKIQSKNIWFYRFTLIGFVISFIFMNIRTLPIWNIIPFHDLIQFPWRLLNFTTFFSAISLAAVLDYLNQTNQKLVVSISLVSMLFVSIFYFHPSKYFYKTDFEYLDLFFNNTRYSEDYLLLPNWVSKRPLGSADKLFESKGAKIVDQGRTGILGGWADVVATADSEVLANVYFYPGWVVKVEDSQVEPRPVGEYGKIGFDVPAGNSKILLMWEETTLRRNANYLTIIFALIIGSIYFSSLRKVKYD